MTTNPIPTLGRIVLAIVDPSTNNGADVAPAVITRVWPTSVPVPYHSVNYRVLSDGVPRADEWKTSAKLYADEIAARTELDESGAPRNGMQAFWPPRADTGEQRGQDAPKHVSHNSGSAAASRPAQGPDKPTA